MITEDDINYWKDVAGQSYEDGVQTGLKLATNSSYWYLCTVYRLHPEGKTKAYLDASRYAAFLLSKRIPVYCPIVYSHYLNTETWLQDQVDQDEFWLEWIDKIMVTNAKGIIVTKMENWEKSAGIKYEIDLATSLGKPIIYVDYMECPIITI